jgi:hypothetical protein
MPVAMLAVELGTGKIWYTPPVNLNAVVGEVLLAGSNTNAPTAVVASLSNTSDWAAPG